MKTQLEGCDTIQTPQLEGEQKIKKKKNFYIKINLRLKYSEKLMEMENKEDMTYINRRSLFIFVKSKEIKAMDQKKNTKYRSLRKLEMT